MTLEEYYELLQKKHQETDWTDRAQVIEYNRYARELREMIEWEMEHKQKCETS